MAEKYNYYSPLDDAKKIVENKGLYANEYNNAMASGASGTDANTAGQPYRDAAKQYYDSLKANGYEYLANELANTDYAGGLKLLQSIPQTPQLPQNQYTYNTGNAYTSKNAPSSYMQSMMDVISPYMQQTNAAADAYASQLGDLYSRYGSAMDTNTARYNDFWNQSSQYGQAQSARYDDYYNYLKTNDYTKTPYYDSIMSTYGLKGQNAADNAVADLSAENAGNIDSYAAANAKRQQLAFTNAGNAAALNAYDQQLGYMLNSLQSLGVDMTNLQANQVNALTSEANRNAAMLDSYVSGQNGLVAAQAQQGANMANVIGNALGVYGTMYGEDAATQRNVNSMASQDYLGQLDYLLGMDRNASDRYSSDQSLAGTKYNADANVRIQEIANQLGMYQSDNTLAGTKYNADTNLAIQNLANQLGMYQSDNTLKGNMYNANSNLQQSQIGAEADRYKVDAEERMNKLDNETQRVNTVINNSAPSSERLNYSAVAAAMQGWMSGAMDGTPYGLYAAAAILKAQYPNNAEEIDAFIKDYLSAKKSNNAGAEDQYDIEFNPNSMTPSTK